VLDQVERPLDEPPIRRMRRAVLTAQDPGADPEREVTRARLIEAVPAVRARFFHLVEDLEDAVADALVAELGPSEEARARATIVAAAVFGALRGARRAVGALPHPDPERLVEGAFDLVEHGAGRLLARPKR
jgi:AcrR family transcriptional regulator